MQKLNYIDLELESLNDLQKQDYLYQELRKDVFTLKDFSQEITQRKLNAWHNEDLLLEKSTPGKWRKFNFIEYCWIHLVNELRDFELGYNIIKNLKEQIMQPVNTDLAFEEPVLKNMIAMIPEENRADAIKQLTDLKFKEAHMKGIKLRINVSILFMLIFNAINLRKHTSISFLKNGFFIPVHVDDLSDPNRLRHFTAILDYHFFTVSLTDIIRKFLIQDYFDNVQTRVKLLTQAEEEVFKHLRAGDCKSITVNFSNGKPVVIEVTQTHKLDTAARIADIITKGYHNIVIKAGDGKVLQYENTRKINL